MISRRPGVRSDTSDSHLPLRTTVAIFALAKLVSNIGTRFVYAFLPTIARGLGVPVSQVGWLASGRWAVGAVTPATVRLAGREHRRRIVATGLVVFSAGAAITAVFGVFAGAALGFVLMGLGKPLLDTGLQAATADRVTYATRARTIGVLETTWALGLLVGAPLAGWMIDRWGWEAPFWAVAIAGLALVIPAAIAAGPAGAPESTSGVKLVLNGRARWFLVAAVLIAGSAELVFITFATWLEDVHGFGLGALAALATGLGVAELAAEGTTILATDRLGKARAVAFGMMTSAAGFAALAVGSNSLPPALGGLVVGVAGFEFAIVSSISLATELVPKSRVQLLSRMVVAQALGRAAAAVVGLSVYALVGMAPVGLVAAATSLAAAWVVGFRVREHAEDAEAAVTGGSA